MNYEVLVLEAEEFGCEYYNIPRAKFVELAAQKYQLSDSYLFAVAVRTYDEIQKDMMEVA